MTVKPVLPRERARQDVEQAVGYYADEAGQTVALGFIDAIEQAYQAISAHPGAGSLRYAYELNLPGLRVWQTRNYPFLIFYLDRDAHIDVWRVLHASRDVPGWMQEPDAAS